jgi:uncharacterized protein (TIGR02231 family)
LAASNEQIGEFERLYRQAQRDKADAEAALERCDSQEKWIETVMNDLVLAVSKVPRGQEKIATWGPAYEDLSKARADSIDATSNARFALEEAKREEERANLRWITSKASSPRYEASIEVQVESPVEQDLGLRLSYRVPCALWRPEHLFRLAKGEDGADQLEVVSWATLWQSTGEKWENVACRFSTARPSKPATAPLLTEDVLKSRKKTEAERRQVVVEARDQAIEVAGLSVGTKAVEEMPGVDDGGEVRWFESNKPITIPSDGQPMRVEIGKLTLSCQVDYVAYPERSPTVYVRARANLSSPYPLLAGPAWMARHTELVGRSKVRFVGPGTAFEVGLGVDDSLRIRRTREEKREVTSITGTQKVKREIHVFVSNLGQSDKRIKVIERFPVSEIEAVTVALVSSEGAQIDSKDGFATFETQIAGNSTKTLMLAYRLEAGSNVSLPE